MSGEGSKWVVRNGFKNLFMPTRFGSFPVPPPFKFNFENFILRCHNALKFGMVNKSTTVNRFVLHTLHRNSTHLAIITRKTNIKLGILKGGNWKRAHVLLQLRTSKVVLNRLQKRNFVFKKNQLGVDWKKSKL